MPKNPYNNLSFDNIDGFEFFLIFLSQILSYLPLLQEGTTAWFLALGSSHNRPCYSPFEFHDLTLLSHFHLKGDDTQYLARFLFCLVFGHNSPTAPRKKGNIGLVVHAYLF